MTEGGLNGINVLLGVSGGIAAYKAADLASKLTKARASVTTVMTENACRLVRPKTFEAVTANPVFTSMWTGPEEYRIGHIDLADRSDLVIIAPATANIIAKAAHGISDDLLSTTICVCWEKPTLLAPAMNTRMWENPITQQNVQTLKDKLNFRLVGPATGSLACKTEGVGRMSEPADILHAACELAKTIRS
ncbi:DNA/pantothenate metabolism flavoprotein [Anaerohalosphaera lusitana]|uniref:DNA/pantothenate metabolism flavoprotein n=1 Tax=Anaerohalosphaera lusitana TaxID=1936003 RepID=A0A1U9NHY9_9BACT|nr:flavoprotein [Anaerohalosphaera lusitana]AQT67220.1 DNA/pantothenate metabolism flavoprotein [Anaerohalosphaera lusitana]